MTPSPKKIAVPKMPTSSSRARSARAVLHGLRGQREHGDEAALAVVVRAQDERDVLQRDDDRQRPEHQRQDAQHVVRASAAHGPSAKTSFSAYRGLVPMSP
jgi:hypothetical protein